jgi:predicted Zn finger-like uncharacterized protein
MDVRCERCGTEYEFDEDRITEAGVAVRCTHCGHVFMVKKKSVVVTGPVPTGADRPPMAGGPIPAPSALPPRAAGNRAKEWKVRQPNGNLITFKELTTLQKWIVERKVSRNDEISMTGQSWKRLGNIAELSSFFQVVDEAQRAAALSGQPAGARPLESKGHVPAAPQSPEPVPQHAPGSPTSFENFSFRKSVGPHRVAGFETTGPVGIRPASDEPAFTLSPGAQPPPESDDDVAAAAGLKPSARRPWSIVLFAVALAAVSYLAYRYFVWMPERQRQDQIEAASRESAALADQERVERERTEQERAARAAEELAKVSPKPARSEPMEETASPAPPAKPPPDRATGGSSDVAKAVDRKGSTPLPGSADGGEPRRLSKTEGIGNFDTYMTQGDRLREREQPGNALDAYAKAAELEPGRPEPLAGRGLALLDLGKTATAIAALQQALKIDPRYGLALMGLAEAYRAEGNKDEAIRYYEKYLDVHPDGPEAPVAEAAIKALQE